MNADRDRFDVTMTCDVSTARLVLRGEVDLATETELANVLADALATSPTRIVVDASAVTFISPHSLGLIEEATRGVALEIVDTRGTVRHLAEILRMDHLVRRSDR